MPIKQPLLAAAQAYIDAHFPPDTLTPVLGVHIRGTDMWLEYASQALPSLRQLVARVQDVVDAMAARHGGKQPYVFVAADSTEAVAAMHRHLKAGRVLSTAADRTRWHNGTEWFHPDDKANATAVGWQVLLDVVLLSRSSALLHDHSSVSLLASLLSPAMQLHSLQPDGGGAAAGPEHAGARDGGTQEEARGNGGPSDDDNAAQRDSACFAANKRYSHCSQLRQSRGVNVRQAAWMVAGRQGPSP